MNALNGLRVLNTRPILQSTSLRHAIETAGGLCIDLPGLLIEPIETTDWQPLLPPIACIDHCIFTSTNAVHYFFSTINESILKSMHHHRCITAIGCATAHALEAFGMHAHQVPTHASSEDLLKLPSFERVQGNTIVLIKGTSGRTLIANALRDRKAHVIELSVYQTKAPVFHPTTLRSLWQNDAIDIILFTSEQAMQHVFTAFTALDDQGLTWLRQKPCLVISERLATIASSMGINVIQICHHDALLTALQTFQQRLQHRLQQGPQP